MARRGDALIENILIIGGAGFLAWKFWPNIRAMLPGAPQQALIVGSSSTVPKPGTPLSSSLTGKPLGIRQNNPGNIRYSSVNNWTGQTGNGSGYVIFSAPEYGYRALFKLLKTYINTHGLDTIAKIGQRWAPPSENPTSAWVSNVALMSGVSQHAKINPNDQATMIKIARGITGAENGSAFVNYYSTAILNKAWGMA